MQPRDDRRDDYAFISGSRPQPWHRRYKRKIVCGGLACLAVVTIIVFIVASKAKKKSPDTPENGPGGGGALRWDGECPWEPEECPRSFRGRPPPLLLVSLDGFRAEYLRRTPVLGRLAACAASAPHLLPVFPSKTFPNHFSIVTGLHPSSHGIVDNSMRDGGRLFRPGSEEALDPFWWEREPIWVTAMKQGLKAATFFWPGSDVKINGSYPTYYEKYNSDVSFETRVDQVLAWLDLPEEDRPHFLTLYLDEPDAQGHAHGIHSQEVAAALARVDGVVERLLAGLQQRNLTGCLNLILLSDHGMSNINCSKAINIEKYINVSEVSSFLGTVGRLRPRESSNTSEAELLSALQCQSPHMRAYAREQLPLRMHYSGHRRIEPVLLELDSGWTVMDYDGKQGDKKCSGGAHGYDNLFPDMRALFIAAGPSFKKNTTVDPFMNIELYELMCELLNITAQPNNGTRGSLHALLREPAPPPSAAPPPPPPLAPLPQEEAERAARVAAARCPCHQRQAPQADVPERERLHLPFGAPRSPPSPLLRLLVHRDFVSAFHTGLRMPAWASFTVPRGPKNVSDFAGEVCWSGDARLDVRCLNATVLEQQRLVLRPLYPEGFSAEARLVSNAVPKSVAHAAHLEARLAALLAERARDRPLNVLTGPAFARRDPEGGGVVVAPSHIFVVATWCEEAQVERLQDCPALDCQAFLLPNHPYPRTCGEPAEAVVARHAARVADVEALTGLSLFAALPPQLALRLRTRPPQPTLPA